MRGSMARRGLAWRGPGRRVQPKTKTKPQASPEDPPLHIRGQGRPCSRKMVQSAERGNVKDKRERIFVFVRSPYHENYPAQAHTSAHKSVLESANPAWTQSVHLDAPGQWHGQ